jgi:hypothetical protein
MSGLLGFLQPVDTINQVSGADPLWFQCGSRSGSSVLGQVDLDLVPDPDPGVMMTKNRKKKVTIAIFL